MLTRWRAALPIPFPFLAYRFGRRLAGLVRRQRPGWRPQALSGRLGYSRSLTGILDRPHEAGTRAPVTTIPSPPPDEHEGSSAADHCRRVIAAIGSGGRRGAPVKTTGPRDAEEDSERARRQMLRRRRKQLDVAWRTIPDRFRWASFADRDALEQRVKSARAERGRGSRNAIDAMAFDPYRVPSILLMGPSETGKTSLACACLRFVLDAGAKHIQDGRRHLLFRQAVGVQFMTAYHLAKAQIYSPLGRRPELIERAIQATVLVIDELGMDTEVFRQSATSVREVIHERHSLGRATVITTYLAKKDLLDQYGHGIANRIAKFRVVVLQGGER